MSKKYQWPGYPAVVYWHFENPVNAPEGWRVQVRWVWRGEYLDVAWSALEIYPTEEDAKRRAIAWAKEKDIRAVAWDDGRQVVWKPNP